MAALTFGLSPHLAAPAIIGPIFSMAGSSFALHLSSNSFFLAGSLSWLLGPRHERLVVVGPLLERVAHLVAVFACTFDGLAHVAHHRRRPCRTPRRRSCSSARAAARAAGRRCSRGAATVAVVRSALYSILLHEARRTRARQTARSKTLHGSSSCWTGTLARAILCRVDLGRRIAAFRSYLAVERNYSPRTVEVYLRDVASAARAPPREARARASAARRGCRRSRSAASSPRCSARTARRRSVASCRACGRSVGSWSSAACSRATRPRRSAGRRSRRGCRARSTSTMRSGWSRRPRRPGARRIARCRPSEEARHALLRLRDAAMMELHLLDGASRLGGAAGSTRPISIAIATACRSCSCGTARAASRARCRSAVRRSRAIDAYLPARARSARPMRALFVNASGERLTPRSVQRMVKKLDDRRWRSCECDAARLAPLVRDPPARRGRRPALDPGAARSREPVVDADLHEGLARPPNEGLRRRSPAREAEDRPSRRSCYDRSVKVEIHSTTILSVRRGGKVVVAGDGQVTLGNTVVKGGAQEGAPPRRGQGDRRVRRVGGRRHRAVRAARRQAPRAAQPAAPRRRRAREGVAHRPRAAPARGDARRRRRGGDVHHLGLGRRDRARRRRLRDRLGRQLRARRRARAARAHTELDAREIVEQRDAASPPRSASTRTQRSTIEEL